MFTFSFILVAKYTNVFDELIYGYRQLHVGVNGSQPNKTLHLWTDFTLSVVADSSDGMGYGTGWMAEGSGTIHDKGKAFLSSLQHTHRFWGPPSPLQRVAEALLSENKADYSTSEHCQGYMELHLHSP
jgi:hypothetical protein